MNIQQYGKLTLVALFCGALSAQAHANACGDESPLKMELGDAYYDLDYAPDRKHALDDDAINALFDRTEWRSGDGVRYKCFGADARHRTVPTEFSLEDIERIETLNGSMQLNAWENSDRKVASATFYVADASQWTQKANNVYQSSQLLRRAWTLRPNENNFNSAVYRFFDEQGTATGQIRDFNGSVDPDRRSYMVEITTSVERRAKGLVLTQTFYVNGFKGEWFVWNLDS